MKVKKLLSLLLSAAICVGILAGCGNSSDPGAESTGTPDPTVESPEDEKYGGTLTAYFTSFPTTCFLPSSTRAGDRVALQPALEQLGRLQMDGSVEPFLAESFAQDVENLTFTIKIRQGITFHDGSELNAEVVKWNIDQYIENGKSGDLCDPTSVEATDEYTVVVHYDTYSNLWETALGAIAIASKQAYEENGEDYMATNAIGTGPFIMTGFSGGNSITYEKNENYWQEGLPYLDAIDCVFIDESTTLISAFLGQEVDEIQHSEAVVIQHILEAGYESVTAPSANNYSVTYCIPNSYDPESPWANDDVRTAVFHHGIDWDGIANALTNGLGSSTPQWGVSGSLSFDDDAVRGEYDVELAKQMLSDAGYPDGFETVIWTSTSNENRDRATLIQGELENLGITAKVELYDDAVLGQMRNENTPGIYISEGPSSLDMSKYLNNNFSPNVAKFSQIIDYSDTYADALNSALQATTMEEKSEYLKIASRALFVDENKVITMSILPAYCFQQDYVHDMGMRQADAYEWTPELCWLSEK